MDILTELYGQLDFLQLENDGLEYEIRLLKKRVKMMRLSQDYVQYYSGNMEIFKEDLQYLENELSTINRQYQTNRKKISELETTLKILGELTKD